MKWLIPCALLAVSAVAAPAPAPVAVGARVPDFSVQDLSGKTRTLSDLQKESPSGVVALCYWNTACHCSREMEGRLDALAAALKGKATVAAVDATGTDTPRLVTATVARSRLSLPVVMDPKGQAARVFGARFTTTTVIIDGQGVLRYRGRFDRGRARYAEDAVRAVLAGKEVRVRETEEEGCPLHP